MNSQTVKGNWEIAKTRLQQKYAILTEDDFRYEEGREEALFARIQQRTGAHRDEIERFFEDEHAFH